MANVSDIIEQFILSNIGADTAVELSRRELADHFSCAPSQINYVLSTRFTVERGYLVEGKRGGGGCIKLYRLTDADAYLSRLRELSKGELTESQSAYILEKLVSMGYITEDAAILIKDAMSDKSLECASDKAGRLRSDMLRSILLRLRR